MADEQLHESVDDRVNDADVIAATAPGDTAGDTARDTARDTIGDTARDAAPDASDAASGDVAIDAAQRVAELERRVAELERQVEQERDQATDYMRRWHTAQADFSNYKRRQQQEQEQRERLLTAQALAPVLSAMDSLERAFIALPASLRSFSWIEGIALVELQLRRALELGGIQPVEAEPGQPFDPMRHEPIGEVETEQHAEGAIAVVAQRGYESHGLLIRPTLVQLARKPKPTAEPAARQAADQPGASAADTSGATESSPGT